jgi:hypothetical protein
MKKMLFGLMALAIIVVGSAFAVKQSTPGLKKTDGYFYKYVGVNQSQGNIKESSNYIRSNETCQGEYHVCGVFLPSDNDLDTPAPELEFADHADALWLAESTGNITDEDIVMKN